MKEATTAAVTATRRQLTQLLFHNRFMMLESSFTRHTKKRSH